MGSQRSSHSLNCSVLVGTGLEMSVERIGLLNLKLPSLNFDRRFSFSLVYWGRSNDLGPVELLRTDFGRSSSKTLAP